MDNSAPLEPAAHVIEKCGGIDATASLAGLHRSVVNRWQRPKDVGGTGGLVPAKHQPVLIANNPKLSPDDFFVVSEKADAA